MSRPDGSISRKVLSSNSDGADRAAEDLLVDDVDAAERLVDDAQTQGVLDAVFFHTLTSGFAAPVRAVGDVVSYAVRPISRRKRRRTDDS